jgi:hypothetical protein
VKEVLIGAVGLCDLQWEDGWHRKEQDKKDTKTALGTPQSSLSLPNHMTGHCLQKSLYNRDVFSDDFFFFR